MDQQFMDLMGSPYLLAHGLGSPVENASTNVQLPENGTYYIFVRTYNWTSPWQEGEGPGLFGLSVNGKKISYRLGIIAISGYGSMRGNIRQQKRIFTLFCMT